MDLINFLRTLLKRKWLLVLVPIVAMAAVFFLTRNAPKSFKSKAQLATGITETSNVTLDEDKEVLQPFIIVNKFGNLMELMRSKQVLSAVAYRLILHDLQAQSLEKAKLEGPQEAFRQPAKLNQAFPKEKLQQAQSIFRQKLDSIQPLSNSISQESELLQLLALYKYDIETLRKEIKIERLKDSDFIAVEYESENPHLSAFVVNVLCEEFIRYNKIQKAYQSNSSVDFFAKLAEKKKRELDAKVDALKRFKLKNRIINIYEQTKSIVNQKSTIEIKREEENKKIPSLEQSIQSIDSRFTSAEKGFIEAQTKELNQKIAVIKAKLNRLNENYIVSNFSNSAIYDSILNTREALDFEISKAADAFFINPNAPKQDLIIRKINDELDLEMARASVASLDQEIARLDDVVASFAPMEASIGAFEREISVASDVYLLILNKWNAAQFATLNLGDALRQVEFGQPAAKAEASKTLILIIMAGAVSFVFCIVIIFLLEYIDLTVKTPDHFKKETGVELLGYLNRLQASNLDLKSLFEQPELEAGLETFKQLLRNLRYELEHKVKSGKTILFTSTKVSEGKTFIISALAYSLYLLGKKVLIVDTNFRNNALTQVFSAKSVINEIQHELIPTENLISQTTLTNVDVIGCTVTGLSPSEIFAKKSLSHILADVVPQYDFVLLEGCSLNKYADSKELIDFADKIVLVFPANTPIEKADKNSIIYLKSLQEKFIGAIFNKVDLENLEQVVGEVSKKRSGIRKFTKRMLKRNLQQKSAEKMQVKIM